MKQHDPSGWWVKCLECRYGRRFGRVRVNADLAAMKHRNRFHHAVGLYGVTLEHLFEEMTGQGTLEYDDDAIPF